MHTRPLTPLVVASAALLGAAPPQDASTSAGASQWVYVGSDDHLHYKTDAQGNHIMDFSSAGYLGGGVALPVLPVAATVSPASGDDTANIQAAIDTASKATPDANGLRGAVLLQPGTYDVSGTLNLAASGIVLRGSGSGSGGTVLTMTGSPHLALSLAGAGSRSDGASTAMASAYVPSGSTSFGVADASKLAVGDKIVIGRPVTQSWVDFMGMDKLTTDGAAQTWIGVGSVIDTDRVVTAISGNTLTLDAPLADSFDPTYLSPPGGTVATYTFAGRITNVGVEHLSVVAPAVDVIISSPQFTGVQLGAVADSWVLDVAFQDTQNTVTVDNDVKRVTIDEVHVSHTITHTGDRMADFGLSGTQVLVNKSSSDGTGEWPLVTQGEVTGPIVALNFTSTEAAGIGPHQRWAVGLLADNATLPNAPNNSDGGATGISFSDRGNHGSGQGWAMGWGVAWNVTTPYLVVQEPPGAQNWCIGCAGTMVTATEAGSGKPVPNGAYDSPGAKVSPNSLYLAQLCDRLGPAALVNIGYSGADCAVPETGGDAGDEDSGGSASSGGGSSGGSNGGGASGGGTSGAGASGGGASGSGATGTGSSGAAAGGGPRGGAGSASGCAVSRPRTTRVDGWLVTSAIGALGVMGVRRKSRGRRLRASQPVRPRA